MLELTDSQKILLAAVADEAGCEPSSLDVVLRQIRKLRQGCNTAKRMVFTALGEMPAEWIDGAMSNLMARNPKKQK